MLDSKLHLGHQKSRRSKVDHLDLEGQSLTVKKYVNKPKLLYPYISHNSYGTRN